MRGAVKIGRQWLRPGQEFTDTGGSRCVFLRAATEIGPLGRDVVVLYVRSTLGEEFRYSVWDVGTIHRARRGVA